MISKVKILALPTRLCLLAMLALSATSAAAQTREETEFWIIKQTQPNVRGLSYAIEGDNLVRRVELPWAAGGGVVQMSLPIKQISAVGYAFTDRYLSYSLLCETPCTEQWSEGVDAPDPENRRKLLFEIYRKLDPSFPPRMHKALLKLIELHGGKARLFQLPPPPKEPF